MRTFRLVIAVALFLIPLLFSLSLFSNTPSCTRYFLSPAFCLFLSGRHTSGIETAGELSAFASRLGVETLDIFVLKHV